ncbi:hypothetical protein TCAL_00248 [Tigriopus californicus]|uniref:FCP1 homology domain-containing protein n=1 Tax=Tigriopus californicus TaxID=6832 RepID=A0A553P1B1_TIGCA|nr:CTD small phosphatase-like protein 2 [Tigriopus californicus]TRY71483.1 hypothetical protein TCAL_00248 [Tigriopus californicus]|eukprot:TCALIF_00248-PA protein Name:"Similar to CTDSPL2 CTD small phosphatase-like protein 2 (Gallus gallus)" AED:0.27 eAED:0.27 QI:654/1/1/1/1/1/2/290/408
MKFHPKLILASQGQNWSLPESSPSSATTMPTTDGIAETTFRKYAQVLSIVVRNLVNSESSRISSSSSSTTTTTTTNSTLPNVKSINSTSTTMVTPTTTSTSSSTSSTTKVSRAVTIKSNKSSGNNENALPIHKEPSTSSLSSYSKRFAFRRFSSRRESSHSVEREPVCLSHVDRRIFHLLSKLDALPPSVKFPVIPHKVVDQKYTLVLDMDETLIHSADNNKERYSFKVEVETSSERHGKRTLYVSTRPYLEHFLEEVNRYFEVIVFTAGNRSYADAVLNNLDPKEQFIQHRLYRDSCIIRDRKFIKDLNLLGRDLDKTIIVDNSLEAFGLQLDNGLLIPTWSVDQQDECLLKLVEVLKEIATKQHNVPDYLGRRYGLGDDVRSRIDELKKMQLPTPNGSMSEGGDSV